MRLLLLDHLKDADLLMDREDATDPDHFSNSLSTNDEMVKAVLLMGFNDRILRVRRGRMVNGVVKPDEIAIVNQ